MLRVRYYTPAPSLAHLIRCYYAVDADVPPTHQLVDTLVPEVAKIRVQLSGRFHATLLGLPRTAIPEALLGGYQNWPVVVDSTGPFRLFGVELEPLGWTEILRVSAAELADDLCDLSALLGSSVRIWVEQLREAHTDEAMVVLSDRFFQSHAARYRVPDVAPALIQHMMKPQAQVDAVARAMSLSARQLERWSLRLFGCTPKLHLRKQRIQPAIQAFRAQPSLSWLEAAGPWFYDQPHFIKEFKRFTGRTPSQFQAEQRWLTDVAFITRDRMLSQKLRGMLGSRIKTSAGQQAVFEAIDAD
jgi:AraC-like DNA-binding protein